MYEDDASSVRSSEDSFDCGVYHHEQHLNRTTVIAKYKESLLIASARSRAKIKRHLDLLCPKQPKQSPGVTLTTGSFRPCLGITIDH